MIAVSLLDVDSQTKGSTTSKLSLATLKAAIAIAEDDYGGAIADDWLGVVESF